MLGPSILFFSPPFCTGYAFHACRRGDGKGAARIGFVLAAAELLFLLILMGYSSQMEWLVHRAVESRAERQDSAFPERRLASTRFFG
jgi:hypothetical protein